MEVRNRFVRSATWEGMASEDGRCTPQLIHLMKRLAYGEVGLIITGHATVRPDGQAGPWQLGIYKDGHIDGLRTMTETVNKTGSRVILQLAHAGLQAETRLTGQLASGPSRHRDRPCTESRVMTVDDIREIVEAFGQAAHRAKKAGFNGVEIHAAHGYLLSQFLSPFYNTRRDAYGGSVENRARVLVEVIKHIRGMVGDDFAVLVKMNCQDFVDEGLTMTDSLEILNFLQKAGIDAVELSGGTSHAGRLGPVRMRINSEDKEAYFRQQGRTFKQRLEVPLILVGGIRSFQIAERLVREGDADYVSMSRPFIREPNFITRWASGDRSKAKCISCNRCFRPASVGEGVYCVAEKEGRDTTRDQNQR